MRYEIIGTPVPWTTHKGSGRKSYSTHTKAKHIAQLQLKVQHGKRPLFKGAVRVDIFFEMPTPKSMSRATLSKIAQGQKIYHSKRPDRSNLEKFAADTLTGTVLHDDNIIVAGETQKYYAKDKPRTIIIIEEIR